jgi:hypothetical protein
MDTFDESLADGDEGRLSRNDYQGDTLRSGVVTLLGV